MNKAELIAHMQKSKTAGFETKAAAERAVEAVLEGIAAGLKKDKSVQLVGFGTFQIRQRKAREGRNPKTGEKIKIKASRTVGFKVGKKLKDKI